MGDRFVPSSLFVVGDIHGCASELLTLIERLPLNADSTVVFIGDYIDRGPHSRQVIEIVMELSAICRVETLMGNHEEMFLDFIEAPRSMTGGMFIFNGGSATLGSYADGSPDYEIPTEHITFLRGLDLVKENDDFFIIHAGVPEMPLEKVSPRRFKRDLLWSRSILTSEYKWSKVIVHGHTHRKTVEMLPNRINVDTGCVYNNQLSAIELPSKEVISVPRLDRTRPTILGDSSARRQAARFEGSLPVHVRSGEQDLLFETVNYSPIGLLIRSVATDELEVNDVIFGTIGNDPATVPFRGVVVRRVSNQDGLFYGVHLTHHG